MKRIISGLAIALAVSGSVAMAQSTSDKPISAVPPAGRSDHSISTNATAKTPADANAASSKEGYAHNTGVVANGPTPPAQTGSTPTTPPSSNQRTTTIKPGPAYNAGTAEVGNSSDSHGILGAQGAGASATMQGGQMSNH